MLLAGPSGFLSLVYFLLSACASGQAEVFVSSSACVVVVVPVSRSPAGWLVPSRASGATQYAVFIGVGTPHVHRMSSGVSVSLSVSGPVLGLGFTCGFFCFLACSQ